jgi:hypothetical protein
LFFGSHFWLKFSTREWEGQPGFWRCVLWNEWVRGEGRVVTVLSWGVRVGVDFVEGHG